MKLKRIQTKVVHIDRYSNTKVIFRKIKLIFGLKKDSENLNAKSFYYPHTKVSKDPATWFI